MAKEGATKSAALLFQRVDLDAVLRTDNFAVSEACVGCGRCARACLASAIEMRDGAPAWVKPECFMCFGCLRLCPTAAIRYGGKED